MSQEPVEIVRRAVDAWNRRDPDLWCRYATPDIEWIPAGPAAIEGTAYRGYDEVVAGLQALWEAWDEVYFEEIELRELSDVVLWLGRLTLKGASSHVPLQQEFAVRSRCEMAGSQASRRFARGGKPVSRPTAPPERPANASVLAWRLASRPGS